MSLFARVFSNEKSLYVCLFVDRKKGRGGGGCGWRALRCPRQGEEALRRLLGARSHWSAPLHLVLQRRQRHQVHALLGGLQQKLGGSHTAGAHTNSFCIRSLEPELWPLYPVSFSFIVGCLTSPSFCRRPTWLRSPWMNGKRSWSFPPERRSSCTIPK